MKRFSWSTLTPEMRALVLARPEMRSDPALTDKVREIVEAVRTGGWEALKELSQQLDRAGPRKVATAPLAQEARRQLQADQLAAIALACRNIRAFHEASLPADHWCETAPGIQVAKVWRPIERVGLYVPGGGAPLFSTLLMLAIPARAAGVSEIVAVTPPGGEGGLHPMIALAADLCGIEHVWNVGGAQAIASLAFGAGDIPRVDKICGPGNAYVTAAKALVAALPGGPAIDLPAGPSELMVIADADANSSWIAADLLSQAEHDAAAQVLLVTTSSALADAVESVLAAMLAQLPRSRIAAASIQEARILLAGSAEEAIEIANLYAPEHLSLATLDADTLLPLVRNAGAVFVGGAAAETFGDYVNGPSHVLPTDGAARAWSGISVHSFLKNMSVQKVSEGGVRSVAREAAALARMEGLEAHARAAEVRLERAQ